jgi:hypothetical protein
MYRIICLKKKKPVFLSGVRQPADLLLKILSGKFLVSGKVSLFYAIWMLQAKLMFFLKLNRIFN